MPRTNRRVLLTVGAAVVAAISVAGTVAASPGHSEGSANPWPYSTASHSPVLAVVGDISCEPDDDTNASTPAQYKCGSPTLGGMNAQFATADQIEAMQPDLVALLGDEQYQVGKLSDFDGSFDKSYGAFKFLERPAPGNHEFYSYKDGEAGQNGTGYYSYFNGTDQSGAPRAGGQAGDTGEGWYSYNLGGWHLISLNLECESPEFGNSCDPTTGVLGDETQWLSQDLKSDTASCTLAYWHQPAFTATGAAASPESAVADDWWKLLYAAHADLILNGHEHVYARYSPQNPAGAIDQKRGITQFTVGTGGEALDTLARNADGSLANPNIVTAQDAAFGVMKLTLNNGSYSWDYHPVLAGPGQSASVLSYDDSGSARCHPGH